MNKTIEEMKRKGMPTEVCFKWCAEDVLYLDDTLSADQVDDVLSLMESKHDCNYGMTWDIITDIISIVKDGGK